MITLHIVPLTHWDREWYLPFQSFRIKLIHLIDQLLDILDRDPTFKHFMLDGQTIILEDYLTIRPEREADLIRHIRAGRIDIGPWYTMPDEYLVSPEAIIRNLLRGESSSARFGSRMNVGYIPDPFGHISQIPQILLGFGIDTAAFRRGLSDEPLELWWESPDGSRVLTSYLRDGYDNAARMPTEPHTFANFVDEARQSLEPHSSLSHLLLMNGTDHHEAQPEIPSLISNVVIEGATLLISTLPEYFAQVKDEIQERQIDLPVLRGELRDPQRHHLLSGVLSSRVWIKQRNHHCEILLERWVEPFSAWAEIVDANHTDRTVWTGHLTTPRVREPGALINHAWQLLLQCQPHDSICGCSIDQVHQEMRSRFDQVIQIGEEVVRQSLSALATKIDTSSFRTDNELLALVVFNPNAHERTDVTEASLELSAGLDPFEIIDDAGQVIPYYLLDRHARSLADLELDREALQAMLSMVKDGRVMGLSIQAVAVVAHPDHVLLDVVLAEEAEPNLEALEDGLRSLQAHLTEQTYSHFRLLARFATKAKVSFIAANVPGYGYRTFGLRPALEEPRPTTQDDGNVIENSLFQVEVGLDGSLALTDRRTGNKYTGLLRFRDQADRGDSYTFCPLKGDQPIETIRDHPRLSRTIDPADKTITIDLHLQLPKEINPDRETRSGMLVEMPIKVRVCLREGVPRVDLEIEVENPAKDHRLQVLFPMPYGAPEATYDGHFEMVQRKTALLNGDPDWAEQPTPEVPFRNFVAVQHNRSGFMIAARGLREVSVSPVGVVAVTLLRCFGWLSRDDLATRKGGAGPQIATPGGQVPGRHTFQLSLIPFRGDLLQARAHAEAFQTPLRAVSTTINSADLPPSTSFLAVDPPAFAVTSIKQAKDGSGIIVRGVNLDPDQQTVKLKSQFPIQSATLTRIDETPIEPLEIIDLHSIHFNVKPQKIVTINLLTSQS